MKTFLFFLLWTSLGYSAFLTYRVHQLQTAPPLERIIERVIYTKGNDASPLEIPLHPVDPLLSAAANIIRKFEACKLAAYVDPRTGGKPITIGYGSTRRLDGGAFKLGDTITKKEAENLLIHQLKNQYIPSIAKVPHWNKMGVGQKVALISFGYNLGKDFYGNKKFKTITKCLAAKEWRKIPETLKLYSNPGTRVHDGLLARRIKEGKLWANN